MQPRLVFFWQPPIGLLLPLLDKVVDKLVVVHEELPIVPLGRNILGRDEFSHPAKSPKLP